MILKVSKFQSIFLLVYISHFIHKTMGWEGRVVFEDDFNNSQLDFSKWKYEEGCEVDYGIRYLHCYSRHNVLVENGSLIIIANQETVQDRNYTTGRLRQRGFGLAYGTFVARARFAHGDHLLSSVRLLPNDDICRYEEIDIALHRGQDKESNIWEMSALWGQSWELLTSQEKSSVAPFELNHDFHEFAVKWSVDKIEWYLDDKMYYEVSLTDGTFNGYSKKWPCRGEPIPFTEPTNFVLSLAVGGTYFSGYPAMNPETWNNPTQMEVDWVRIYQT